MWRLYTVLPRTRLSIKQYVRYSDSFCDFLFLQLTLFSFPVQIVTAMPICDCHNFFSDTGDVRYLCAITFVCLLLQMTS